MDRETIRAGRTAVAKLVASGVLEDCTIFDLACMSDEEAAERAAEIVDEACVRLERIAQWFQDTFVPSFQTTMGEVLRLWEHGAKVFADSLLSDVSERGGSDE